MVELSQQLARPRCRADQRAVVIRSPSHKIIETLSEATAVNAVLVEAEEAAGKAVSSATELTLRLFELRLEVGGAHATRMVPGRPGRRARGILSTPTTTRRRR